MAVLGLRFCARASSSCGKWGPLFIAVRGPFTITASLVVEHRLQTRRLSSCGSRAQPLCGMWDPPRPGLEPVSSALAGRLSTTAPPGKSLYFLKFIYFYLFILFLAALGLRCCAQAFSSCSEQGLLFVAVRGLLIMVASLVAEHQLQEHAGFSSCGSWAQQLWLAGLVAPWHVGSSRPGLKPMSPAFAGGFPTTAPPGKPSMMIIIMFTLNIYCMDSGPDHLGFNFVSITSQPCDLGQVIYTICASELLYISPLYKDK